ncbi:MAG: hypothetical protein IH897_16595, partial [Planctomycetes bacterium]|nr:hypothetical protein [Planctomycetota bacterium]
MSVCHLDVRATRQSPIDCRGTAIRRRRKTLATIVGVIVMLGLGEAAVRIRAWYRFGSLQVVADIYLPNARLGRSLRPGAVINGSRRQVSINRWGFRGPEVPRAKPPNTVRIADRCRVDLHCATNHFPIVKIHKTDAPAGRPGDAAVGSTEWFTGCCNRYELLPFDALHDDTSPDELARQCDEPLRDL